MTFATWVNGIVAAVNTIVIPLIIVLAGFAFLAGIVYYFILHGAEEDKRAEGRQFAVWGIIGMVVLFSVWTLVGIILSTLGITPSA